VTAGGRALADRIAWNRRDGARIATMRVPLLDGAA